MKSEIKTLLIQVVVGLMGVYLGYKYLPTIVNQFYNSITIKIQEYTTHKNYAVELDKDIMIVTIPQFTVGIVGFNEIDWGELNIMEVVDDLFQKLKADKSNSTITIDIAMYSYGEDKYGNRHCVYRLYELMTVNLSEVKKYINCSYFERDYNIVHQITRLPFDKRPIKVIKKNEKDN